MFNKDLLIKIFRIQNIVNVTALANQAGLNKHTAADIWFNKLKNPGVYTVAKIADVFGCSIDELLSNANSDSGVKVKVKLIRECINIVFDLIKESEQTITFDDVLRMLKDIYLNSVDAKITNIDIEFAKKYVSDFLNQNNVQR